MTSAVAISLDALKRALSYDQDSGIFVWQVRPCRNVFSGDVAGVTTEQGYIRIQIQGRLYFAHRLAWFYTYGVWPSGEIDHKNGEKGDNKIANLREANREINGQNQSRPTAANRVGLLGVGKRRGRYRAQINVGDSYIHLGTFDSADDAHAAYLKAKRSLHVGCLI